MKRIFKVLQGQHKGAELALPEGAVVKAGRAATCDLVLRDATLAEEAFELTCSADAVHLTARMEGVVVGDQPVAKGSDCVVPLYTEVGVGMTRFCLGEAEQPWPTITPCLVATRRRRRRWGWGLVAVLLLGGSVGFGWWFVRNLSAVEVMPLATLEPPTPETLAEQFGLVCERDRGGVRLVGNLPSVRDRDRIRQQLRALAPEVRVELTDDETLRQSVETLLATLNVADLHVLHATNRCVALTGSAPSPAMWARIEEAIRADVPYVRTLSAPKGESVAASVLPKLPSAPTRLQPALPIAAILSEPYSCLILKNGLRCSVGAVISGYTVVRIAPGEVTLQKGGVVERWTP